MMLQRKLAKVFLAALFIYASANRMYGSTDVWVSHIASQGGWRTILSVYYTGTESATPFTLTRISESGDLLGDSATLSAINHAWISIPDTLLAYSGNARILSNSNLLVKVGYRFGESLSSSRG